MTSALDDFLAVPTSEVEVSGAVMRYRRFGQGPAVLFVHGWPLCGATYRELVRALAPQFSCYVPDLPGAGDTPWSPHVGETASGYTRMLRGLVDALELGSFAIVAHDSGGGAARLLAAELGPRVSELILQNTELPDHVPPAVRMFKALAYVPGIASLMPQLMKSQLYRHSALGFGDCFGDRALIEAEFMRACIEPLMRDTRGALHAIANLDLGLAGRLSAVHAQITARISLFWGGADPFFPLARARSMFDTFQRRGSMQVIDTAKLYVHEEAPQALASFCLPLLQNWADTLPGRRGASVAS